MVQLEVDQRELVLLSKKLVVILKSRSQREQRLGNHQTHKDRRKSSLNRFDSSLFSNENMSMKVKLKVKRDYFWQTKDWQGIRLNFRFEIGLRPSGSCRVDDLSTIFAYFIFWGHVIKVFGKFLLKDTPPCWFRAVGTSVSITHSTMSIKFILFQSKRLKRF